MIVGEHIENIEKEIDTNPGKDMYETDKLIAIKVVGDPDSDERMLKKRETNLTQGIVEIGDSEYEIFLK